MAAISTATRAVILDKVLSLANQLIAVNEAAKALVPSLVGLSDADAADTIDKLLSAGGIGTGAGTGDTISDEIIQILNAAITVSVSGTATALSWTHTV